MSTFFVTGTDTEVGKTFITQAILRIFEQKRKTCIGYKPVAAGSIVTLDGLQNEDAVCLQESSTFALSYDDVNTYSFQEPIAPHIAAAKVKTPIAVPAMADGLHKLQRKNPDILLVEGAGGWRLPLGNGLFMSDFVKTEQLPVLLVVGMRLGCLNHAILTAESIVKDGLSLAGWVANHVQHDMPFRKENVETLKQEIDAPFLGEVPMVRTPQEASHYLDITPLMQNPGQMD